MASSSPSIDNNIIRENSAVTGGAIYCRQSDASITNNIIGENSADVSGGGIYCYESNANISNNTISGNSADWGGGVYCRQSNPTISNNTIRGNSGFSGGGICCYNNSAPTITNNTISGNVAGSQGGGIVCAYSSPTLINNTITGNTADVSGGGIYCELVSNPIITNTIFWADSASYSPEIDFDDSSSPYFTYCDIQGGWAGEGNMNTDPLFRDPENGDFHLMADSCGDVYNSPCIDGGDPAIFDSILDCDWGLGENRSDIGAYGGARIPTDIDEEQIPEMPRDFILSQNCPNPFNARTRIGVALPEASDVNIDIYSITGQLVETISGHYEAGNHSITWNASDVSSGIYFYRVQAGGYSETKRMVLLK